MKGKDSEALEVLTNIRETADDGRRVYQRVE